MLGPPLGPSIDMMSMASTFSSAVTITPWSISLFILFLFNCHERKKEKSLFYWQLSILMFCTPYALCSAKQNLSIDFLCSSVLCLSFLSFCPQMPSLMIVPHTVIWFLCLCGHAYSCWMRILTRNHVNWHSKGVLDKCLTRNLTQIGTHPNTVCLL